jgi:hypothetical protein
MVCDTKKKAFVECFLNFMSDSEGLSQEDLAADLREQKIDINQLKGEAEKIVRRGSEEKGWPIH